MKIVGLTDLHDDVSRLGVAARDMADADVVVISGDLTTFGKQRAADVVLDAVGAYCPNILAVSGNCDHSEVGQCFVDRGISVDGCSRVIDGVAFVGVGGSLPSPGRTPNEHSEEALAERLARAVEGLPEDTPLILVSHPPPIDTATDFAQGRWHVGSRAVRSFIEERCPLLCFCGHIHESSAIDTLGTTRLVNPGPLARGHYACAVVNDGAVSVDILG